MISTQPLRIDSRQRAEYRDRGYFILENVISPDDLAVLRAECDAAIVRTDARMDASGKEVDGISVRKGKYFINFVSQETERLDRFLYGDLMEEICRATIGDDAFLFYDQFVVKGTDASSSFAWHQDSGYVGYDHRPYLTCWCALDDVSVENGTVHVLPYARAGTRTVVEHQWSAAENARVGYFGSDPGDAVIVPAGSVAVFSSVTFHRSGANTTDRLRRAYVVQYSPELLYTPDRAKLHALGVPFLSGGKRVR
jgi:ectoine hydroxylase-related dioxygenase (phytanoyl-CoA dioxygenase family)